MSTLTSAEKLVLITICRYWTNPYWASNAETARLLGFSERYVEKVVKSLAVKGIIKRGYAHTTKKGRPHTVRVIVPRCLPGKCRVDIKWVKTEHMDGQQAEHIDGESPNSSSFLPEQSDDLLEKNRRKNRKATPSPSPAGGEAPALSEERDEEAKAKVERFKRGFGAGHKRRRLTDKELEAERQKQIAAVRKK